VRVRNDRKYFTRPAPRAGTERCFSPARCTVELRRPADVAGTGPAAGGGRRGVTDVAFTGDGR
jgi:hypothetical protein